MKAIYLLILLFGLSLPGLSQNTFQLGVPKSPDFSGMLTLQPAGDGYWYQKSRLGPVEGLKVDANVSSLPTFQTLAGLRSLTLTASRAPVVVFLNENWRNGEYHLQPDDTTSPDNGGTVIVTASNARYKLRHSGEVSIVQFGAIPNDGLDDTDACRRALSAGIPLTAPGGGTFDVSDSLAVVNAGNMIIRGLHGNATFRMNADKNLFVFVSNASGGGIVSLTNLNLDAGANMFSGAAIKVRAGLTQKVGRIEDITMSRPSGSYEWRYGIRVENPAELVMRNCIVRGNGPTKLVAYELTSTVASISPSFQNLKGYDAFAGIQIRNNSVPGLEGLKIYACDFVGVEWGIDAVSTSLAGAYIPPGLQIDMCHINATGYAINVQKFSQVAVTNSIIYLSGGSFSAGLVGGNVSQMTVSDCKFFNVGSGSPYGVLLNGGTNVDVDVHHNYFSLRPAGTEQAVWFGTTTTYSKATDNVTVGLSGNTYAAGEGGIYNENGTNTVRNNLIHN